MHKIKKLLGMTLIAMAVLFPMKANAAGNVCQTLKEEKTYQYNLDKKGEKESVKISDSLKKYEKNYRILYDHKITVTVNGKKIYTKTIKEHYSDVNPVKVMVTDTDKKDKQMELLVIVGCDDSAWTTNMEHIYYYQYANGKAKRKQDLAALFKKNFKDVYFLHGMKENSFLTINGKGEIYTKLCMAVQDGEYDKDYLHMKAKLVLKNGKFLQASSKSYSLLDAGMDDIIFSAKKNITAYTQAGGKKNAFTVKKGENIYPSSLYLSKNQKLYLKIKNKKGRSGYIELKKGYLYFDGTYHI